jgi:DNA-directed RNA polymerase subunit RPC12/RpoP
MPKLVKKIKPNLNNNIEQKTKIKSNLTTKLNKLINKVKGNKNKVSKISKISKISKFIDDTIDCRICGDDFESDKEKEPLVCGHVFHYDCIVYAFQSPGSVRQCPYCRKYHGYLVLKPNMTPLKQVHKEYIKTPKNKKVNTNNEVLNTCAAILSTGSKAGLQCSFKSKHNGYCGIHKNLNLV